MFDWIMHVFAVQPFSSPYHLLPEGYTVTDGCHEIWVIWTHIYKGREIQGELFPTRTIQTGLSWE